MINNIKAFISSEFSGVPLHDKIYKLGAYAFGLYLVVFAVAWAYSLILRPNFTSQIAGLFAYIIAIIFTCAIYIEYSYALRSVLAKSWVKWVGAGVAYFVFRFSEGKSEDFVNNFTGIDPSALPNAVSLLATLFLPYSWVVLIAAILGIYVIAIWLAAPFQLGHNEKPLGGWKFLGRAVGLLTIFVLLQQLISGFDKEDSIVAFIAKETTLRTEYFGEYSCTGIVKDSLVADIGGGFVSVFTPSTTKFEVKKCDYDIAKK